MFATKINSTDNRNSTFFWRRTPTTVQSTTSQKNQKAGASGNNLSQFPAPPPPTNQGSASLPGLNPTSWREIAPSLSSSSKRSTHNTSARAWTNPYQTLTAGGRKRIQKLRQKISRAAEDNNNSAIPSFLKILNVPKNKQKVTKFFAAALERKAQKLKMKAMKQNGSMPRGLYRGPKLNWIEIQALEREADEEEGKQVDMSGNVTGVSNINEILQQTCPVSYHVPQVVMPGGQEKSDGDVNDGDTDPGTDTDNEGGDTDVEDENKENVDPGSGLPRVQSPIACLHNRTEEPKTPINTCGPSAYRATVEDVEDEERILKTPPISATTEGIFAAPRKPANHEQVFPECQSWDGPRPMESTGCPPSQQRNPAPSISSSSSKTNVPYSSQQRAQLPLRSSFPSGDGPCTSQEQRQAGSSLNAFYSTDAQHQRSSEPNRTYFTVSAQPTNLQQPGFSFPPSQPSYIHFASGTDAQPTAPSQSMTQPVFPVPNAPPSMPQAFSNENSHQPQCFATNTQSGFQQQTSFNWTFQPAVQSVHSFHTPPSSNGAFQPENTFSQPNATSFQTQTSNGAGFPTLEATFAFFSVPQFLPTVSRPILRRLPVLAPDDTPDRPILFGPHGIQTFLKEKPIPVVEEAPLPREPLENFDYNAWNEKIKRRSEAFQARRRRSGPLGKLPPSPRKSYVGRPPRGSEEDMIRRLELQRKYEENPTKAKTKKRVRFLLPDESPRKKRRIEESTKEITRSPTIVLEKQQSSVSQTIVEADPLVPGAYDIQWDDGRVVAWKKPRQCPSIAGFFSFLFGNSAGHTQTEGCPV